MGGGGEFIKKGINFARRNPFRIAAGTAVLSLIPFREEANLVSEEGIPNMRNQYNQEVKNDPPPIDSARYPIGVLSSAISQFDRTLVGEVVNKTRFNTAMRPPVYEHLVENHETLNRSPLDPEAKNIEQEAWLKSPKDTLGYQVASRFSPEWRQHTMEWTISAGKKLD